MQVDLMDMRSSEDPVTGHNGYCDADNGGEFLHKYNNKARFAISSLTFTLGNQHLLSL
jgi:hypothetical protein